MKKFDVFSKKSLIFAPMEGVTEGPYRLAILKNFPEWDQVYCDFYRVPTVGKINERIIREHIDERILKNPEWMKKTSFQILTSPRSQTKEAVEILETLNIQHLDLNLGCPSKKVNSHQGGAYLLSDHLALKEILKTIRSTFSKTFTVKMRIGYRNDSNFLETLKLLEGEGVEAITLHARTRDQLYKGKADWNYIKQAVEHTKIPIIGNGDIWTAEDIETVFESTQCHSIMFGRSAMKTPWLAKIYKEYINDSGNIDETFLLYDRKNNLDIYYNALLFEYRQMGHSDSLILKRFKSISLNIYDDYENSEIIRGQFLRSATLDEFFYHFSLLK